MASKIAVLVKRFPKLSETFIAGEIEELLRQRVDLKIFSIYRPNESIEHRYPQALFERVVYLDEATEAERSAAIAHPAYRDYAATLDFAMSANADKPTQEEGLNLLAAVNRHGITHIHAHYLSVPTALADLARGILGTTYSISAHAKDIYLTDAAAVRTRLARALFLTTCTTHNAEHLKRLCPADAHKVLRVYHGIDTAYFCPLADDLGSALPARRSTPQMLSIGRFRNKKGFDLVIEACAELHRAGRDFTARIVGYGEQEKSLQKLIEQRGLTDKVRLCGPVDRAAVRDLMRSANVFVMPCRIGEDGDRDGIPNTVLEAMSCAMPVVSTRVSGIPEIIDSGCNGLLVASDNAAELATATCTVLDDAALAARLGRAARRSVCAKFDWCTNVSALTRRLGEISDYHK